MCRGWTFSSIPSWLPPILSPSERGVHCSSTAAAAADKIDMVLTIFKILQWTLHEGHEKEAECGIITVALGGISRSMKSVKAENNTWSLLPRARSHHSSWGCFQSVTLKKIKKHNWHLGKDAKGEVSTWLVFRLTALHRKKKIEFFFSCPEQLNRWPCHSLTQSGLY